MEKMGGGGHHSASATQISNEKIENVLADLKRILGLYINDITWKEPGY
jgi:c-di-AMP phosphodiesterase-like protein